MIDSIIELMGEVHTLRALLARCHPYIQQAHLVLDQDYANRPYDIETRQLWLDMCAVVIFKPEEITSE